MRRLKQLEEENARLKRVVADLTLDKVILQDVIAKKALKPARKRTLAKEILKEFPVSVRQALTGGPYFSNAREVVAITG